LKEAVFDKECNTFKNISDTISEELQRAALVSLAHCYLNGVGCEKNWAMAHFIYRHVHETMPGSFQSVLDYAHCLLNYKMPAEDMDADRAALLRHENEKYAKLGYQLLLKLEADDEKPQNNELNTVFAMLYIAGNAAIGIEKNPAKAVEYLTKGAEEGEPTSCYELAKCFKRGYGVERQYDMYRLFLEKAAKRGHPEAMHVLRGSQNKQ